MKIDDSLPWMTILMVLIALVVVVVGGITVITGHLEYEAYLNLLWKFGAAVAALGIGRGLKLGLSTYSYVPPEVKEPKK